MKKIVFLTVFLNLSYIIAESNDLTYYKNGKFLNEVSSNRKNSFLDFLKWKFSEKKARWPKKVLLKNSENKILKTSLKPRITFINHSTFLIQVDGVNILTDPIFSDRSSPLQWIGPKRVIAPGIDKEKVPKVDIILISHNHYDHLDTNSLKYFKNRDNPKIFGGLGIGNVNKNFEIIELKWWQEVKDEVKNEKIMLAFTPSQHFSGRTLWDRNETLWGAFFLKTQSLKMYFAGDTGYSHHFKALKDKYGTVDIAFLPIGAYAPRWFMKHMHMNPSETLKAHHDLNARISLGMHWGTFQLSNEPRMEPVNKLTSLVEKVQISNFRVLEFGETIDL